jgi:hypothetical protein
LIEDYGIFLAAYEAGVEIEISRSEESHDQEVALFGPETVNQSES